MYTPSASTLQLKSVTTHVRAKCHHALICGCIIYYNFIQNTEMLYLPIPMLQDFGQVFCYGSSSASMNTQSTANLARAWGETQPNKNPWVIHTFEPLMDLKKREEFKVMFLTDLSTLFLQSSSICDIIKMHLITLNVKLARLDKSSHTR